MRLLRAVRPLRFIRPRRQFAQTESRPFTSPSEPMPWFIDPAEDSETAEHRQVPPHLPEPPDELPANIPEPIRVLYNKLSTSPFLEPSTLVAREPPRIPPGPALPTRKPKGRRRIRGVTYAGQSTLEASGGIWNWVVMAQVKEGTENRGSIESVVRVVRKTLLSFKPPLPLPPNSKRYMHSGWAMIDAGNFAVHIMSKQAHEKYFDNIETRPADW
ncbi:hypothetical protein PILCRDRAFT_72559 [Piloderma croceum F 1598]|uniref:Uncharacterized protein n=1 Tax=Piloderma croceum (strain F 1598) TaxID=765440 RepID=A0A0C3BTY0_PILCF|nr:hypothetical protein PILCRDRAFT_72559 [Piloderma croceum F 1598]